MFYWKLSWSRYADVVVQRPLSQFMKPWPGQYLFKFGVYRAVCCTAPDVPFKSLANQILHLVDEGLLSGSVANILLYACVTLGRGRVRRARKERSPETFFFSRGDSIACLYSIRWVSTRLKWRLYI